MNVNGLILELGAICDCPVVPDLYRGDSDKWITFTYTDERGSLYGNDAEIYTEVSLNISYYCPESFNYMSVKKKIKKALVERGFNVESVSSYIDDSLDGAEYLRRLLFKVNYTNIDN